MSITKGHNHRDARPQHSHHFEPYNYCTTSLQDFLQPSECTGGWVCVDVWTTMKNGFQLTVTASNLKNLSGKEEKNMENLPFQNQYTQIYSQISTALSKYIMIYWTSNQISSLT